MKRFAVGLLTFAVVLASLITLSPRTASASGTDVVWLTKKLNWASAAGAALTAADSLRWQTITDENDSTRTAWANTSDWNWEAFGGMSTGTAAIQLAYVTFAAPVNNMAAGNDTVYYTVEKRAPNGKVTYNATMAAALGSCAVLQGAGNATNAVFRGCLLYDPDTVEGANGLAPGEEFRLVVKGDQGATTPALGRCEVWVTYPARRASSP